MIEGLAEWARNAPADDFWEIAIILTVVTAGCFFGAFYYLIRRRIIQDIPTSKIRSAAQGYVELAGRSELMPGEETRAPLTNTLCTWFHYKIEKYRRSGKRSRWVTIEQGTSDSLFLLVDDTGQAVVDPDDANITPAAKDVWYGRGRKPEKLPSTNARWSRFLPGIRRYRYTEKRVHPGDPLYAIGLFTSSGGGNEVFNINKDVRDLLKEWKQDSESLLKQFDSNQDNKIDMNEWNKVRETALSEVMARHGEMKKMPVVHMMNKTCDVRRPYLLSAVPESDLVKKYGINAGLCISAFFIAGILATWIIGIRLAG